MGSGLGFAGKLKSCECKIVRESCFGCESGRLVWNGKWAESQKWEKKRPEKKMAPKWRKHRKNDPKSKFCAIFGPFSPHFGPWAVFYFSANVFGLLPVFHSIPGGLTRNALVRGAILASLLGGGGQNPPHPRALLN